MSIKSFFRILLFRNFQYQWLQQLNLSVRRMKDLIEKVWNDRSLLQDQQVVATIRQIIEELDKGRLRVAEPGNDGNWIVNEWIKKAVILYFPIQKM